MTYKVIKNTFAKNIIFVKIKKSQQAIFVFLNNPEKMNSKSNIINTRIEFKNTIICIRSQYTTSNDCKCNG